MDLPTFESRLRERLAVRWACPDPVGLPASAIELQLAFLGAPIPVYYQRFLETCGGEAGTLFRDYHWTIDTRDARNRQLRLVSEEFEVAMPADLFTFLDYLGDYFWCFALNGDPNPEVLMFDLEEVTSTEWRFADFVVEWDQLE